MNGISLRSALDNGSELRIGNEPEVLVTRLERLPDKSGLITNATDRHTKEAQIYHVFYPDGLFRRITNDLDHYQGISMTADGRRLVTMQQEVSRQIGSQSDGKTSRLTVGGQQHIDSVDWIGDDSIAFSEDVDATRNNYNIWRMLADGSEKQQFTFGGGYNVELTVSPDERYIAFISRRSGRDQVWRVGVDGSDLVQLTNIYHNITMPVFSSDSENVFFLAVGRRRVSSIPGTVEGGDVTPFLNDEIYHYWAPSPDSQHVAYLNFDRDARSRRVFLFCLKWSANGRDLFFTSALDGVMNVWRSGLDDGKPEPITAFADERIFRFAISPRLGRLAVVRESITCDAIMLTAYPE